MCNNPSNLLGWLPLDEDKKTAFYQELPGFAGIKFRDDFCVVLERNQLKRPAQPSQPREFVENANNLTRSKRLKQLYNVPATANAPKLMVVGCE